MTTPQAQAATIDPMNWKAHLIDHQRRIGKVMQWAQLMGVESMQAQYDEQQANRDAESSWVRRNVWGSKEAGDNASESGDEEGEAMRQTILGDVTHPTPMVISNPPQQNGLGTIGALALGALGPSALLAGAIGYWLANSDDPPTPEFEDSTAEIRLGKIEDYLKANP